MHMVDLADPPNVDSSSATDSRYLLCACPRMAPKASEDFPVGNPQEN